MHGFGHVQVIWQNWVKNLPNMGVAVPWAPVGTRSPEPLKSLVTGPSLLVDCYLEIKFHIKIRVNPPPPPNLITVNNLTNNI